MIEKVCLSSTDLFHIALLLTKKICRQVLAYLTQIMSEGKVILFFDNISFYSYNYAKWYCVNLPKHEQDTTQGNF